MTEQNINITQTRAQQAHDVGKAYRELKEAVLNLRYQNLTIFEISKQFGISESTVRTLLK